MSGGGNKRSGRKPHRTLVTGASAGLGRAIALQLLEDGRFVTGVDRDAPPDIPNRPPSKPRPAIGADTGVGADTLGSMRERYRHERCDLAAAADVDALLERLVAQGPYDLVVMAAGVSATGRFEAIPADAYARLLRVNSEAPLVLADGLIGAGALGGGATLVLVASLSVDVGYPGAASYAASKDALHAYGRSLRLARKKGGQRARLPRTLVAMPGPLRTEHARRHAPEGANEAKRMTPEECARRILSAVRSGQNELRPGAAATMAGWFGRLLPGTATGLMRRTLFEKLDREVW